MIERQELEEKVHQTIVKCWSDIHNAGEFDSQQAIDACQPLIDWIWQKYQETIDELY